MSATWWEQWLGVFRSWPWHDARSLFELILYFLAVLGILGCLLRLGTIRTIIRDFREARGPIWDLRNTVNQLNELEPVMRTLAEQVALVDERVEAWGKQVAELQVEAVSSRTAASDESPRISDGVDGLNENRAAAAEQEDQNWLTLRDFWRRNTMRLEYVIDQISDGRSRLAFDRLPRTNYERIINKLQGQKLISIAGANASRSLNELFYRYRPRNRAVPDEVVESLRILDGQLDTELVPVAKILAADDDEAPRRQLAVKRSPTMSVGSTPIPTNGQGSSENLPGQPNP